MDGNARKRIKIRILDTLALPFYTPMIPQPSLKGKGYSKIPCLLLLFVLFIEIWKGISFVKDS
jgi:hypothetical protein